MKTLVMGMIFAIFGASALAAEVHYFVQAGAFSKEQEALDRAAKVKADNLPATVTTREVGGRTVYRVRIGPIRDKAVSDGVVSRLEAAGIQAALVLVEGKPTGTGFIDNQIAKSPNDSKSKSSGHAKQVAPDGQCRPAKLGSEMSAAQPVPLGSPGSWIAWNRNGRDFTARTFTLGGYGPGTCTQDKAAAQTLQMCRETANSSCVSLGGCPLNQIYTGIAVPKDWGWVWIACSNNFDEARSAAKRLCEIKSGCPCTVEGTTAVHDRPIQLCSEHQ